ncbi:hypothetical protein BDZ97DRAFT_1763033 [Flammula alnicola]|nr:hypothetical protein BDZ97DRAFT_1763033 [Flammula alnicola]
MIHDDNNPQSAKTVIKDQDYCIESDFVVFQVENTLFRVPSYQFMKESSVFATMFELPQAASSKPNGHEGISLEKPIKLPPIITCEDFRNLLKALYPRAAAPRLSLSKEEWISILKLSSMWYFIGFRAVAISQLELEGVLTSVEKITLARTYRVSSLLTQGLSEMVDRPRVSTITNAEALDVEPMTAVALLRIREEKAAYGSNWGSAKKTAPSIEREFNEELKSIQSDEAGYKDS